MKAVDESDPTYSALLEALTKAKAQIQVRPVEERVASIRIFIERAKKRIGCCREEVVQAQEAVAKAQSKLQSEEQALADGEARLAAEPPTMPANFAHELAELRVCVQELRRENTELRSDLQIGERDCEERERERRKQAKNLSNSTLDLVLLNRSPEDRPGHGAFQSQPVLNKKKRTDASARMETMIDNADSSLRSNRFNPLSGWWESRPAACLDVTGCEVCAWERRATPDPQMMSWPRQKMIPWGL